MNNLTKRFTQGLQFSAISLLLMMFSQTSQASLSTDLQGLVSQGNALNLQMSSTQLTADNLCNKLLTINRSTNDLIDNIALVEQGLLAPISVDSDTLTALNDLSSVSLVLANEALRLSLDMNALSTTATMYDIADGLNAMLQLSSDIGTMADRILEMADNILLMADNIGQMADLIIQTQEIQNQNIALTQASILTTQDNILTLVSVVSSDDYSLGLQNLLSDVTWLSMDMEATILTSLNMARKLAGSATDVASLKDQFIAMNDLISLDAASNTFYINQASFNTLLDISLMLNSMAIALEGYALAVDGLQAVTSDPTLDSAMASMLQMSSDIGIMANRILEMADLILAMADNIGVAATNIVAVQELQNINIKATQAAVLSAQTLTIGVIAAQGL